MNYLAQGLNQGFATGQAAYEARKKREQDEALAKAKRDLELQMHAERLKAEEALQNARLVADAKKQFNQQNWETSERSTERGWRTGERIGSELAQRKGQRRGQKFTAEENERNRAADREKLNRQLDLDTMKFNANVADQQIRTGLLADQQAYEQDPNSPRNLEIAARADAWKSKALDDNLPGLGQKTYKSTADVKKAMDAGEISRQQAEEILMRQFGIRKQAMP